MVNKGSYGHIYRNSDSVIRINSTVADKFDLIVGVHQGFVLSPLLFIIVLEALLRECWRSLPMLYGDNLVINAGVRKNWGPRMLHGKITWKVKGLGQTLKRLIWWLLM